MRKLIIVVGLLAALAVTAGSAQARTVLPPSVICGLPCDGGGGSGWTGCTQQTAAQDDGIPYVAYYRQYLVVNYCKRNGFITSISIAAHGCDSTGAVACSSGEAWQTGGGVGTGYATFTGHATYIGALAGVPWFGTSVVNLSVALG